MAFQPLGNVYYFIFYFYIYIIYIVYMVCSIYIKSFLCQK